MSVNNFRPTNPEASELNMTLGTYTMSKEIPGRKNQDSFFALHSETRNLAVIGAIDGVSVHVSAENVPIEGEGHVAADLARTGFKAGFAGYLNEKDLPLTQDFVENALHIGMVAAQSKVINKGEDRSSAVMSVAAVYQDNETNKKMVSVAFVGDAPVLLLTKGRMELLNWRLLDDDVTKAFSAKVGESVNSITEEDLHLFRLVHILSNIKHVQKDEDIDLFRAAASKIQQALGMGGDLSSVVKLFKFHSEHLDTIQRYLGDDHSSPYITSYELPDEECFVICCTDGLENLTWSDYKDIPGNFTEAAEIAQLLVERAFAHSKDPTNRFRKPDDITATVITC